MVFPWPGSSACKPPSPMAMNAAVNRNQTLRCWAVISSVNLLRGVCCWLAWRRMVVEVAGTGCDTPVDVSLVAVAVSLAAEPVFALT